MLTLHGAFAVLSYQYKGPRFDSQINYPCCYDDRADWCECGRSTAIFLISRKLLITTKKN